MEPGLRIHLKFEKFECDLTIGGEAPAPVQFACAKMAEILIPLARVRQSPADVPKLQLSLWRGALPLDAIPAEGALELFTAEQHEWAV
jgi:hypothetical protein